MFTIMIWDAKNLWTEIAEVGGFDAAFEAYYKACQFAEVVGKDCVLMDSETGEIVALQKNAEE